MENVSSLSFHCSFSYTIQRNLSHSWSPPNIAERIDQSIHIHLAAQRLIISQRHYNAYLLQIEEQVFQHPTSHAPFLTSAAIHLSQHGVGLPTSSLQASATIAIKIQKLYKKNTNASTVNTKSIAKSRQVHRPTHRQACNCCNHAVLHN